MRIAVIAHIRHPIAEPFMGGMEAHASLLCRKLRHAGHDVTLLAAEGSDDQQLVPICDRPYEEKLPWARWRGTPELLAYQANAFAKAQRVIADEQFDVVHNNSLFTPLIDWAHENDVPMVTSQHVPPFGEMADAVGRASRQRPLQFTFTSRSQLPLWFDQAPANARVVYNGIDCDLWRQGHDRSGRFIWTGRITPNKGLAEAVAAASLVNAALDIAGPVEDREYFEQCLARADKQKVRYLGQLNGESLRSAVRAATAALVTPMWDEPFGLVAAEALASGVPVLAFDRGAMREVVGPCGYLVSPGDVAGLADAIALAKTIDRDSCRQRALELFSAEAMITGYEEAYETAIAGSGRGAAARSSSNSSTCALLA